MAGQSYHWFRRKRTYLPPDQPAPPVASNTTANGTTLTWDPMSRATFYRLEQSINNVSWTETMPATSALTFDVTGLGASSLYYFRLTAGNSRGGYSSPSEVTTVTLDTPTPPATPAAPTLSAVTTTTVTVDWTTTSLATSYRIERALASVGTYSTVFGPNATARTFTDSNLTAATGYLYRVVAINADGSTTGPSATVTTAAAPSVPAVPAQPTATQVTSTNAQVAWVAVSGATSYELQSRRTAPTTTAFVTIYTGAGTSFQATGMSASSTYEFKVRAINSAGASAYSTVRTVTTGSTSGTNVQPVSALYLRQNTGVATHPNFGTGVFAPANAPEYLDLIGDAGFGFIRGNFANENVYLPLLRARGMKWICGVTTEGSTEPTNQTVAETRTKVRDIRENAADVIVGIEGINEPNHNRGTGGIVDDWAVKTVNHQRAIWQEAKWNLTSVNGPIGSSATAGSVLNPLRNINIWGPSLHDIACEQSYGGGSPGGGPRHWHQLLDEGILGLQNGAGFHCYPGAGIPLRGARNLILIDEGSLGNGEGGNATGRLELMWSAYGVGYPSYTTEWGYHNAVAQAGGHIGIDERGAGIYAPRGYIQMLTTPYRTDGVGLTNNTACTWFEALDDQDDNAKDSQEANFGLIGYNAGTTATNPANWRLKPQYDSSKAFLTHFMPESLDAPDYVPSRVLCNVTSTTNPDYLEWQVFATKAQSDAGTATVCIYRRLRCWNRGNKTVINVPAVPVVITDRVGARTFQVGAPMQMIDLR